MKVINVSWPERSVQLISRIPTLSLDIGIRTVFHCKYGKGCRKVVHGVIPDLVYYENIDSPLTCRSTAPLN